jgi:AsmA protein
MQETGPIHAQSDSAESRRPGVFRRYLLLWIAIFVLILLAIVPPLISVNRFQRRIATSISQSLGRPVHLDRVTLNLLPLPGFTLENLVVDEDPAFGFEPIIRANSVRSSASTRIVFEGTPDEVIVNDGSVPEIGASTHTKRLVIH